MTQLEGERYATLSSVLIVFRNIQSSLTNLNLHLGALEERNYGLNYEACCEGKAAFEGEDDIELIKD